MFPLAQRKLIRGATAHVLAGLGMGADYVSMTGTVVKAPFDGIISIPYIAQITWPFNQGGKWIRLTRSNGDRIELAHNSKWIVMSGYVKAGTPIALTGNTGKITTGPHCHVQIFRNGKRLDPEKYNWAEKETIDIPALFKKIWHRDGAQGELKYFAKRLSTGSITDKQDMVSKMMYWYMVVYPLDKYSTSGDARWQLEKLKY